MDDDDEVPPLEDMTEVLERLMKFPDKKAFKVNQLAASSGSTENVSKCLQDKQEVSKREEAKPDVFGGLKKGFLYNDKTKKLKSNEKASEKLDDMPFIKKKSTSEDSRFRFDEIQATAKIQDALSQNQDELLTRIQKNETLCKRILDPSFMSAVAEFQKNPEAAMEKYKDNHEMQRFFKEFCSIMGDHFTSLGDDQPPQISTVAKNEIHLKPATSEHISEVQSRRFSEAPVSEEDKKVKEILDNPEMKSILLDPEIRQLMEAIRSDPSEANRLLHSSDPELHRKVRKLFEAGLLQINH